MDSKSRQTLNMRIWINGATMHIHLTDIYTDYSYNLRTMRQDHRLHPRLTDVEKMWTLHKNQKHVLVWVPLLLQCWKRDFYGHWTSSSNQQPRHWFSFPLIPLAQRKVESTTNDGGLWSVQLIILAPHLGPLMTTVGLKQSPLGALRAVCASHSYMTTKPFNCLQKRFETLLTHVRSPHVPEKVAKVEHHL